MNTLFAKFRALFRRRNLEAEMAEEMRQHLERRIQEKITDGMAPDDARFAAQREFGGIAQVQEQCRDERRFVWLEQFFQDARFAVRSLRKNPGFTTVAVLTLTLGIGACTAIFSIVDAVLLRPLPYPEADKIVSLREVDAKGRQITFAELNFLDVRGSRPGSRPESEISRVKPTSGCAKPAEMRGMLADAPNARATAWSPQIVVCRRRCSGFRTCPFV